jgi:hypothetical protein
MIDDIVRAQVSGSIVAGIAVLVSLLFLIPDIYSAPLLPIGVSLLAVGCLLGCSIAALRSGLRFWIFPVSLSVGVVLVLVLIWSIYDSQTVLVPAWTFTKAIVVICLLTSVIVGVLSVLPIGRKRFGANLATITSGIATAGCLAIAPLSVEPVQVAFWLPALLASVCLFITAAELLRSRRTVEN